MSRRSYRSILVCAIVVACVLLGFYALAAETDDREPFGLPSVVATEGPWWLVWHRLQAEMRKDEPVVAQCRAEPASCPSPAAEKFVALVKQGEPWQGLARIGHVNRAVNLAIRFKEGVPWTSPLMTFSSGIGDCKHYALVKYAVFGDLGFAPDDLRIVVVKIKSARAQHMVLAVREDRRWLILDNRTLELVDSRDLTDYEPLYSFDYRGMWQFTVPAAPKVAITSCQLELG